MTSLNALASLTELWILSMESKTEYVSFVAACDKNPVVRSAEVPLPSKGQIEHLIPCVLPICSASRTELGIVLDMLTFMPILSKIIFTNCFEKYFTKSH